MHLPSTESCFVEATLSFKMTAGFHFNFIYQLWPGQGVFPLQNIGDICLIFPATLLR